MKIGEWVVTFCVKSAIPGPIPTKMWHNSPGTVDEFLSKTFLQFFQIFRLFFCFP